MRPLIVVAAALVSFAVACDVAAQHAQSDSKNATVDSRMEELKFSQFCTEAAEKFWKRHDWAAQTDVKNINTYTSHYNKKANKCFVDVHGVSLVSGENKVMERDHVYDALEDRVLGGRIVLKKGGLDGEIQSVVFIKDGRVIRNEQEMRAFTPWFQSLMTE